MKTIQPRVHSSVVEHGIADPAVTGSNPVVPSLKLFKYFFSSKNKITTPVGFEPTRAKPNGLAGRRLNHSAKVSLDILKVIK